MLNTVEIPLEQVGGFATDGHLYAIVDACHAPLVPPKMQALGKGKAMSLFQGGAQENYWAVAPYLAQVDVTLLRWLYKTLWHTHWGIFAVARAPLLELHHHFRKFLVVTLPDEKKWLLRYYDPRVLPLFLPTCDAVALEDFFGPVRGYGTCNFETPNRWLVRGEHGME